jgi:hypothetical protein
MLLVDVRARHSLRFGLSLLSLCFTGRRCKRPFVQSRLLGVAIRTDTFALQQLAWSQMRTQPVRCRPRKRRSQNAVVWPLTCATLATSTIAIAPHHNFVLDGRQTAALSTEARRLRRSTLCRLCHCCRPHRRTMLSNSPGARGR